MNDVSKILYHHLNERSISQKIEIMIQQLNLLLMPNVINKKLMKTLSDELKSAKYGFVRQKGHFAGNDEYSYFIFNISLDTLMYYAGLYQQTSFFYCTINDNTVISAYYQKKNTELPYNKKTNPYIKIEETSGYIDATNSSDYSELGGKFKYTIPLKCFESVNNKITHNLLTESYNDNMIDFAMNKVGIDPLTIRNKIYKELK